jgi:hypothetical protein
MPELSIMSMGWGVQTWTMAAMMALDELPRADYLIFADTHHEGSATYEFERTWEPWLVEWTSGRSGKSSGGKSGYMPSDLNGRNVDLVQIVYLLTQPSKHASKPAKHQRRK